MVLQLHPLEHPSPSKRGNATIRDGSLSASRSQEDEEKAKAQQAADGAHSHTDLLEGLRQSPKQVPCSYLYDEIGSALYNQITELEEYYPFRTELAMLHEHAADIISHIPVGSVLVELGCGSAEKTAELQRELLSRDGPDACTFVGIDVSGDFLEQAKRNLLTACPKLREDRVELVQATYMDGVREARKRHPEETLCILWLGSSVGNLDPKETLQFFKDLLAVGGPKTEVLVCTDLWKDAKTLHAAYCDSKGVTEAFILNGMRNAIGAATAGQIQIDQQKWQYEVIVNADEHQVEMYVIAGESVELRDGMKIERGERILMEISRKFETEQLRGLAYHSGFYFQAQWADPKYSIQLFCTPHQAFLLAWRDTDALFKRLHDWNDCPIELRHPFLFYYGHVASFSKIRLIKDKEQSEWDIMFSRGIDPDVQNPSQCHSHPEAPQQWPAKEAVIRYTLQQREAILEALEAGACTAWAIHVSLEHERLHQETLCYMLAQQQKQNWEASHLKEDGSVLQNGAAFNESLARWSGGMKAFAKGCSDGGKMYVKIPAGEVTLGAATDSSSGFVWDNEGPPKVPELVEAFEMEAHPVSIGAFRDFVVSARGYSNPRYWESAHFSVVASKQACPSTWTITEDGDIWVHYPEGTWNWQQVKHRPVWCSLAEATAYSCYKTARIMTEPEYMRALQFNANGSKIHMLRDGGWEHTCTRFGPYPGFEASEEYEEYSTDFFDDKHFVLRGASPYTHPAANRVSFRNFYQDVYPNVFAKFRCCR